MKTNVIMVSLVATLALLGCSPNRVEVAYHKEDISKISPVPTIPVPTPTVPVAALSDAIPTGKKIRQEDIATPFGYPQRTAIDLDGDGIMDLVDLEANGVFYYKKGNADGSFKPSISILKLAPIVHAYAFNSISSSKLPVFLFWDPTCNGYYLPNLGLKEDGSIHFGIVEKQ